MANSLMMLLDSLRSNPRLNTLDEAATKQGLILPVLQSLEWNIFDVSEVTPEFSVENQRVDYALRMNGTSEVFIEVKKAGIDLKPFQEQLLGYSFRQGVDLAILTNGITWWFYLPKEKGTWEERKFYTIDIVEQSTNDVNEKFQALLLKSACVDGSSVENARSIYKGKLRKKAVHEALPDAWNKIIIDREGILVDLLIETAERISGYKPDFIDVKDFLEKYEEGILVLASEETVEKFEPPSPNRSATKTSKSDRRERVSNPTEITQSRLIEDIVKVLQSKGGVSKKNEIESAIYSKYRRDFSSGYFTELVSHGIPRWKHNIAWAREYAKRQGLVKRPSESGRGIWELTSLGRTWKSR